jgi:Arc/MetJ family transcription regulator
MIDLESHQRYFVCMKTTVDIPDEELKDAMRFTRARTKREAIVTAITEFNQRRRMAELAKHAGTCSGFASAEEVQQLRRKG